MVVALSSTADGKSLEPNGHVPEDENARWVERVGWAPRFGQGSITELEGTENILDQQTYLEGKLDDKFFGGKSNQTEANRPEKKGPMLIALQIGITTQRL